MSSMMSGVRMELLTKENYDSWRIHAEALLIKGELWEYVSGDIPMPPESEIPAREKWIKSDRKARAELVLLIHPKELQQIRNCSTSREVW